MLMAMVLCRILAVAAVAKTFAEMIDSDYLMEAKGISGPMGGTCELCGFMECVPHLNFASNGADQFVYAELGCHTVALNVNTASESDYVGNWKVPAMAENITEVALLKRGAVYRTFVNREEVAYFWHPSGFVPCNGSAATALEPVASTQWVSRNDQPLDATVTTFGGGAATRTPAPEFGSLRPAAAAPSGAYLACDEKDTYLVAVGKAAVKVVAGGCAAGVHETSPGRWYVAIMRDHALVSATTTDLADPAKYVMGGVALRAGAPGDWDAEGIDAASDVVALGASLNVVYGSGGRAGLAVSTNGGTHWEKMGEVLAGAAGRWDAALAPRSLARLGDGTFLLVYDGTAVDPLATGGEAALPGAGCGRSAVGGAISSDLKTWARLPRNPLLPPSTAPSDAFDAVGTSSAACAATGGGGVVCAYAGTGASGANATRAGVALLAAGDLAALAAPLFP